MTKLHPNDEMHHEGNSVRSVTFPNLFLIAAGRRVVGVHFFPRYPVTSLQYPQAQSPGADKLPVCVQEK